MKTPLQANVQLLTRSGQNLLTFHVCANGDVILTCFTPSTLDSGAHDVTKAIRVVAELQKAIGNNNAL